MQQSIDMSRQPGPQQQTRRTLLLEKTDGQSNGQRSVA